MVDIAPDKQNIDKLFGNTAYYIDFYQRDYKWTDEPVRRLLDDIFYGFDVTYDKNQSLDPKPETVAAKYPWYYLNTYVTNTIDGRVYVVDGQQRLTTLTLILINLLHRAEKEKSKLKGWISSKIAGQAGYQTHFWMNHERHTETLQALYDDMDKIPTDSGITAQNMLENYNLIEGYLDRKLSSSHKFETFVFYFLQRLVLINLSVEQTDVPMVFEVINDRGVRLRPYEILKGKLLGQIDKIELNTGDYNEKWEICVNRINQHKADEIDAFFIYYLKAKFADNRKAGTRFDSDYHREIFKPDLNEKLKLERNPGRVKSFISEDLEYYSTLYNRIWNLSNKEKDSFEAIYYNRLNEMDSQFLLMLSACTVNDPEEDVKLKLIPYNIDRLFSLLRLQRSYDSNEFADAVFEISVGIREKPAEEVSEIFENKLVELLAKRRGTEVSNTFEYGQFRNTSITDIPARFTRYFFARVDRFIAQGTNTGEKHPFGDLVTKTGTVNGFHIEHILSHNKQNLAIFENDEERFESERNRLGGILLMKGKDNISSNNEPYVRKLKSYAKTLHWNESLREDSYKSKKDFEGFMNNTKLVFKPCDQFGPDELEARQKLLFDISRLMWELTRPSFTEDP
ncbi:hypothetical protein RTM1035_14957 [Roseovarius sp. TM1035]|uniref:DUF262 domain-containing protein n=1 Tax=Roseovarius sp. TM1035 TaxID=391613 RepID=UPI0001556849|nr:DUF262 domain-containing protein [Roseovarius sp. TM1035]AWZ19120.1 Hypothetical protein RAK1035_0409 [Roseovarius sp. AK1035]EDM33294.1 hypothetical protein RTM1035_14957 [Roseovarius sp. TM1035]